MDSVCKQLPRNLFLLGQLKHYVSTDCRKMFLKVHLLAHVNYASTVWSNASEVHLKVLNPLYRRAAKLMLPDLSLSTRSKIKKKQKKTTTTTTRHSSTAVTIYFMSQALISDLLSSLSSSSLLWQSLLQ